MFKLITIFLLCVVFAVGCSKKKEEAERLEQEMLDQEPALTDTAQAETLEPVDTAWSEVMAAEESVEPSRPGDEVLAQSDEPAGFVVQVAACPSLEYAYYLAELYETRGYETYLTSTLFQDQKFYRVRIGGYDTYEDAAAVQTEIRDRYSVSAWVAENR